MRTLKSILLTTVFLVVPIGGFPLLAENVIGNTRTISGIIKDKESRKKLENVNITLIGSNVGTVSNADGSFTLKLDGTEASGEVMISHIGYMNTRLSLDEVNNKELTIWLAPSTNRLEEVVVYGGDARQLVEESLAKIPYNYPIKANMLNVFYRETIQKRRRYIGISEAVMDVYKTNYTQRKVDEDKVQLSKSRRLMSQKTSDTLAVKVIGGPNLAVLLDVVKNPDALFKQQNLDFYEFTMENLTSQDSRSQYVVAFHPKVTLPYALFNGKIFIDRETLAITRAEYQLDLSDRVKAIEAILHKKPLGLRFRPQEVTFLITYRQQNGKNYLNYIRNTIRFKCDWRKRLFSSGYTAFSEMVVVDRNEQPTDIIQRKNAFKSKQIFYDSVDSYRDENFWQNYNIIEPTESLENAVYNLIKKNNNK